MPPRPLNHVAPDASFTLGLEALASRPELAVIVMETIAAISYAENAQGKILAHLLGADPSIGVAMYTALSSASAQDSALRAVAKETLADQYYEIFENINRLSKPSKKRRNEFAHNIWGFSEDIPDTLLLSDSKIILNKSIDKLPARVQILLGDRGCVFVYRRKDLEEDRDNAKNVAKMYGNFLHLLMLDDSIKELEDKTTPSDEMKLEILQAFREARETLLALLPVGV